MARDRRMIKAPLAKRRSSSRKYGSGTENDIVHYIDEFEILAVSGTPDQTGISESSPPGRPRYVVFR